MCGICGIINYENGRVHQEELHPMMAAMKHRGPDDEGTFVQENLGLGFVRLSILDLSSAGHQPMASKDGRCMLVFNGEIFNYLELREELSSKGHTFTTGTDTEVLLAAWQQWGRECLHRFNGMWAFAIFDTVDKKLFAARDRYGIKPFYYTINGKRFIFASEIPPILTALPERPAENRDAIFDYLAYNRTDHTETTFFEGINKLQHGHTLELDLDSSASFTIRKWYDLRERVKNAEPVSGPDEFRELLTSAVELRLRSDVPVGVCLSGGLDSSAIVSTILKSGKNSEINTFSAVYGKGVKGDESEYIEEYNNLLKNMHFTRPTGEELFEDMKHLVETQAEPFPGTGLYAQYRVMKLAGKNVVVTLDGQGADEILAGYHYFFGFFFKDLLRSGKGVELAREMAAYRKGHQSLYGIKTFGFLMLPGALRRKAITAKKGYIHSELAEGRSSEDEIAGALYGSPTLYDALINHFEYKLEHLLKYQDRNSMQHSIEGRVPFLDYRLVERTLALKGNELIRGGITKQILRESMNGMLPEKIRTRQDKVGFGTPEDKWFRDKRFIDFVSDLLNSDSFSKQKFIDPVKAKELYQKHLEGQVNISKDIWKWINLKVWLNLND